MSLPGIRIVLYRLWHETETPIFLQWSGWLTGSNYTRSFLSWKKTRGTFLPCDAMASCPSVCLSQSRVLNKTAKYIMHTLWHDSQRTIVFWGRKSW